MEIPWGAIVALGIYVIGSTVGFVWWMATITVTMQYMKDSLTKLSDSSVQYATKAELAERLAEKVIPMNQRLDRAWEKLESLLGKNSN
jgi:hypothetical protein